jgi:hypothetical protein
VVKGNLRIKKLAAALSGEVLPGPQFQVGGMSKPLALPVRFLASEARFGKHIRPPWTTERLMFVLNNFVPTSNFDTPRDCRKPRTLWSGLRAKASSFCLSLSFCEHRYGPSHY